MDGIRVRILGGYTGVIGNGIQGRNIGMVCNVNIAVYRDRMMIDVVWW